MTEPTKIDFQHRRISQISDFTELIEMLLSGYEGQFQGKGFDVGGVDGGET